MIQIRSKQSYIFKNLLPDCIIFLIGTGLQFITVYWAVPYLSSVGIMQLGSWMILSIPLIFFPIISGGWIILKRDDAHALSLRERLRFHRLRKRDWNLIMVGLIALIVGSGFAFSVCQSLNIETTPPFARTVERWTSGHAWMFALWLLYWPINILGEEFVWRGVILPRMEVTLGKYSWIVNAVLWGMFHSAFGIGNIIVLIPTLIIVPLAAYKTKNTWSAVILHAALSGPGFMALAFGFTTN